MLLGKRHLHRLKRCASMINLEARNGFVIKCIRGTKQGNQNYILEYHKNFWVLYNIFKDCQMKMLLTVRHHSPTHKYMRVCVCVIASIKCQIAKATVAFCKQYKGQLFFLI